jgi:ABC-type branched-subunit amino acid transport system ATPase component
MSMLEIDNIHTYYGNIHALKGISLTVEKGEIVTLIGGNGAGKTTTLRSIIGSNKPRQGQVFLDGENLAKAWRWSQRVEEYLPGYPLTRTLTWGLIAARIKSR